MARAELPAILAKRWPQLTERFWSRVEKTDGCWNWTGGRQKRADGSLWYGVFCIGHAKWYLAHHVAWIAEHGPVPDDLVLRHSCDNPACVRPDHIEPGTQAQNLEDMRVRGRAFLDFGRRGEEHHGAKLSADDVRRVVALRADGLSLAAIGAAVGVDASTIHDIANGRLWSEVTGLPRVEQGEAHRVLVTMNGETRSLRAWCTALGLKYGSVHSRVRAGWSPIEALTTPMRRAAAQRTEVS